MTNPAILPATKIKNKNPVKIYADYKDASLYVAQRIAGLIKANESKGEKTILGLATGSSPKQVYQELVRFHKNEGLSFKNVITFNLDEYYPMQPIEEYSYVSFMNKNLFDYIDILPQNIYIPDGSIALENIAVYCRQYEQKIATCGGLDFQLLGIGRTGHIGFNEPGSLLQSITRLVTLNDLTREDASADFGGKEKVPVQAITMGIKTITRAKEIILLAWSVKKADIVKQALEGSITADVPATYLQHLPNVEYVLDAEAASLLTK
jgi:glucosamine-6-phosphate deaminase